MKIFTYTQVCNRDPKTHTCVLAPAARRNHTGPRFGSTQVLFWCSRFAHFITCTNQGEEETFRKCQVLEAIRQRSPLSQPPSVSALKHCIGFSLKVHQTQWPAWQTPWWTLSKCHFGSTSGSGQVETAVVSELKTWVQVQIRLLNCRIRQIALLLIDVFVL